MNQHNKEAAAPANPLAGAVISTPIAPPPFRLAVAQALMLVVQSSTEQYRRRVSLSLSAAERAARRTETKDHDAHMILCRLAPASDPQFAGGDAL